MTSFREQQLYTSCKKSLWYIWSGSTRHSHILIFWRGTDPHQYTKWFGDWVPAMLSGNKEDYFGEGFPRPETPGDIHPDVSCKKRCATSRNAKEESTFCFGLHLVSGILHHVFATHSAICLRHCDLTELIEKCGFKKVSVKCFRSAFHHELSSIPSLEMDWTGPELWWQFEVAHGYLSTHTFRQAVDPACVRF